MKLSVGTDIVEVSRIEDLIKKARFKARVFSERERAYIESRGKGAAQTAAGMFAAKEAFGKSVGTGIFLNTLPQIEVVHGENGEPSIALSGELAEKYAGMSFSLSISHSDHYAIATVVAYAL